TGHDARAANDDLTAFARREPVAAFIHYGNLRSCGEPDRTEFARARRKAIRGDLMGGLCHPVGLDHRAANIASTSAAVVAEGAEDEERMRSVGPRWIVSLS